MDLEKELESLIEQLKAPRANEEPEKERLQLQLKAMELLLKVRLQQGAVKGGSDDEDDHPSVSRARGS